MNFDDVLNIIKTAGVNNAGSFPDMPKKPTDYSSSNNTSTPESSNKDGNPTEPAQTPNNSAKKPSAMDTFKDEGGYSGIAAEGMASSAKASESANASMDQAQSRLANRRQMRANRTPVPTQKSFNPALASLLAVAAGYASSDAFVSGAGGRTNKDITDGQIAAFNRVSRNQTKARQQTKKNRATTSKVKNIRLAYKEVSDNEQSTKIADILSPDRKEGMDAAKAKIEAMRSAKQGLTKSVRSKLKAAKGALGRTSLQFNTDIRVAGKQLSKPNPKMVNPNNVFEIQTAAKPKQVEKAHAPVPPIQGLVWDQSVKKWRKPENVGKTATEVQGKKRIRGSGLGQAGRSAGGSGSGRGRGRVFSGGRKGRPAEGDIGVAGKSRRVSAKRRRKRKVK